MKHNIHLASLVGRLSIGILLLFHGISKLKNGVSFISDTFVQNGLPAFLSYLAYLGEVIAPIMLILGVRTKVAAILIMGTMLVIVYLTALGKITEFTQTGAWALELQGLYFFGALVLFFTGGGKYALSHRNKWD